MQKQIDQIRDALNRIREAVQARLAPRYQQLAIREQRLVLTAAVLLPGIILIFGVLLPMQDRRMALKNELSALRLQVEEAERISGQLAANAARGRTGDQKPVNLMSAVEGLARQSKVRKFMTRIRPQNSLAKNKQQLMLQLKNAPYKASIEFAHALALQQLGLESMKIQAGKSPGLVHVQAVISGK
jgi:type II secretory pathway component PulM